ncbi:hypothetical protein [Clostridium sp. HCS.1]|uniref:hypothetical protein n=1 Tax=Clostridium sp. HCS.1 TaxID=3238594 RepID=UPI003A0FFFDE
MKDKVIRTGVSLTGGIIVLKLMKSSLTATKGFLAANSKYLFMNTFAIPNSVIIMLILSVLGLIYLWHLDINK